MTHVDGANKGETQPGIYVLEGDRCRLIVTFVPVRAAANPTEVESRLSSCT
jgi:hypothetical protein